MTVPGGAALRLTQGAGYVLQAMAALARAQGRGPVSLELLARQESIPQSSLPKLMRPLIQAGLVASRPGTRGGVALARPASSVSILEILEAAGDRYSTGHCVLHPQGVNGTGDCAVACVFTRAGNAVRRELGAATLAELAGRLARHHARSRRKA